MPHTIMGTPEPASDIYARIGQVAAEWSWLEKLLAEMLSYFCHADPGAMYVISQSASSANVLKWLRQLVELQVHEPATVKILINLLDEIDAIREERNTVAHGLWRAHEEPGFAWVHTLRWGRSEVARDEHWSLADLDALIEDIRRMQLAVGNLGLKLGFLKPDSS